MMTFLHNLWVSNVEILKIGAAWMGFSLFCMAHDQLRWRRERLKENTNKENA